jgi:glycosyltransferase involved in cell wall biosynthesis
VRVGYVVKRYPRYSETFIVNEILAHEAAGLEVEIFSVRAPADTHFQDRLARVRAPVTYLPAHGIRASDLWNAIRQAAFVHIEIDLTSALEEPIEDVYQALLLAVEARRRDLDHLHAHFATTATAVARLAARFAGIPYTFTAHAKDIFHESVQPASLKNRLAEAAAVVTVSDYNLRHLQATFGPAARRACRIYNGLDLSDYPYREAAERTPLVLAVGRLVEKKGFGDLIDACAILARRGRLFRCEIVGSGVLVDDLQSRIEGQGMTGRVELLGSRPQAEVRARLHEASVLVAPCVTAGDGDQDGMPTVLLEAMASGTPCVSTEVAGIPEVVRDGVTGLLVGQREPARLADAIERLLDQPALRVRLGRRARQLVELDFDAEINSARLRAQFETAVSHATMAGTV